MAKCYNPKKGIDDVIAQQMTALDQDKKRWNAHRIASLRGSYEESTGNVLDVEGIAEDAQKLNQVIKTLVDYISEQKKSDSDKSKSTGSNNAGKYISLRDNFSAEEMDFRTNMIVQRVLNLISHIKKAHPQYSVKQILNGVMENGKPILGQTKIFDAIYHKLNQSIDIFKKEGKLDQAEKVYKILEHWEAFLPFVKAELKEYEDISMGHLVDYSEDTDVNNKEDNILEGFDQEESSHEHWMFAQNQISPLASANKIVKMFLRMTPKKSRIYNKDGTSQVEIARDDMGQVINLEVNDVYSQLIDLLTGVESEEQIVAVMEQALAEKDMLWLDPIIRALKKPADWETNKDYTQEQRSVWNNTFEIITAIYNERKVMEPIGAGTVSATEYLGQRIKTFLSTKPANVWSKLTNVNIFRGKALSPNSVYDSKGNAHKGNIIQFIENARDLFETESDRQAAQQSQATDPSSLLGSMPVYNGADPKNVSKFDNYFEPGRAVQASILREMGLRLGIPLSQELALAIANNPQQKKIFIKSLMNLANFGFPAVVKNLGASSKLSFARLIKIKTTEEIAKKARQSVLEENFEKITQAVSNVESKFKYESSATRKNSKGVTVKEYGNVSPSFLGKSIKKIQSFVNQKDYEGLQKYLTEMYGNSSMFVVKDDKGNLIWLNKWLEELVTTNFNNNENALANNIEIKRFTGFDGLNFEDFSPKLHALAMLEEFSFAENTKGYAWLPTFIAGDSGVQKYIKAKTYTRAEILDGMYNVYISERRRMAVTKAANEKMDRDKIERVKNLEKNDNTYSFLPFLNEDFKDADGSIGKYAKMIKSESPEDIKKAIDLYFTEGLAAYKKVLENKGVLETIEPMPGQAVTGVTYKHVQHLLKGNQTIDDLLAKQFYNTKFALIQQLQLTIITPALYDGTKDLQKRYKETITSGDPLSVLARDRKGNKYSETGIERVIYINDIIINSEISNPKFMAAIEKNLGKGAAYTAYLKNNLTDGQGFRGLDSYRSVMGMASKWSEADEQAYDKLKEIIAPYGKDEQLSPEDLKAVANLAAIFQPLKPFYYGIENYAINKEEVLKIGVQHKYAEVLLIPQLLPVGSKLRELAYQMEDYVDENNVPAPVDLAVFTSVVKTGAFGYAEIAYKTDLTDNLFVDKSDNILPFYNEDGQITTSKKFANKQGQKNNPNFATEVGQIENDDTTNQLNTFGYVHQLDYNDYVIQTNVPAKNDTQKHGIGTQIRKLVMSNASKTKDYGVYLKGKIPLLSKKKGKPASFKGQELVQFYNALISANMVQTFNEFNDLLQDKDKLSELFIQQTINNSRESKDNITAYSLWDNGGELEFLMPLFEGMLAHDTQANILSAYRKKVNKQRIKGGSMVQASAYGITTKEFDTNTERPLQYITDESGENILYAECEMPFALSYTNSRGQDVKLNFNDWCNADGSLKTDAKGNPLVEKSYPGILDLVAYRIPTEDNYSMINLKIVRFSQEIEGGVLKVPAEGTTIAGFDFDIDKLYFIRKQFNQLKLTQEQIKDIFSHVYTDYYKEKYNTDVNPLEVLSLEKAKIVKRDQSLLNSLTKMFGNSDLIGSIENTEKESLEKQALYNFWQEAGLEGDPHELFQDYLSENAAKYLKFDEYDFDKTPQENTQTSRNNMIVALTQERLRDPDTFASRYTPGGFDTAKKAARQIRELLHGVLGEGVNSDGSTRPAIYKNGKVDLKALAQISENKKTDPEPNYDPSDISTLIIYNEQNQIAAKLIGIAANHKTNHAMSSLMNQLELKQPIIFGSMQTAKVKSYVGNQKAILGQSLLIKEIEYADGTIVSTDKNMAEFLASSVDAVKDPVLNFLFFNTNTANIAALLLRQGYSFVDIGILLNQPVVKEMNDYMDQNDAGAALAIYEMTVKYKKAAYGPYWDKVSDETIQGLGAESARLSSESLMLGIINNRVSSERGTAMTSEQAKQQLAILELYKKAQAAASGLNEFVSKTKFTAQNSVSSEIGDMYNQEQGVREYLEKYANDTEGKLWLRMQVSDTQQMPLALENKDTRDMNSDSFYDSLLGNPFGFEQTMASLNMKLLKSLGSIYPYETKKFSQVRNFMHFVSDFNVLSGKVITKLHQEIIAFLLENQTNSLFNPTTELLLRNEDGTATAITTKEYYLTKFPENFLNQVENSEFLQNNAFIEAIIPGLSDDNIIDLQVPNIGSLNKKTIDKLKGAWLDLHNHTEEGATQGNLSEFKRLSMDLFLYNFYKVGFSFSPKGFMSLAPTQMKLDVRVSRGQTADSSLSYVEFLNNLLDHKTLNFTNKNQFITWFVARNFKEKAFVYTPSGTVKKYLTSKVKSGDTLNDSFEISYEEMLAQNISPSLLFTPTTLSDGTEVVKSKLCIAIDNTYYIADSSLLGEEAYLNITLGEEAPTMRYVKLDIDNMKNNQAYSEMDAAEEEISYGSSNQYSEQKIDSYEQKESTPKQIESSEQLFEDYIANLKESHGAFLTSENIQELKQLYEQGATHVSPKTTLEQRADALIKLNKDTMTIDEDGNLVKIC